MNATLTVLRPGCGAFCAGVIDEGANLTVSEFESIISQTNAVSEALVLGVSGGDRRSLEFRFRTSLGHCNEVYNYFNLHPAADPGIPRREDVGVSDLIWLNFDKKLHENKKKIG